MTEICLPLDDAELDMAAAVVGSARLENKVRKSAVEEARRTCITSFLLVRVNAKGCSYIVELHIYEYVDREKSTVEYFLC